MSGSEALDALIDATAKAWPQIGTVVDAHTEIARLRAVEKAARMASKAWGRDSRTAPPYLFGAMETLAAALAVPVRVVPAGSAVTSPAPLTLFVCLTCGEVLERTRDGGQRCPKCGPEADR